MKQPLVNVIASKEAGNLIGLKNGTYSPSRLVGNENLLFPVDENGQNDRLISFKHYFGVPKGKHGADLSFIDPDGLFISNFIPNQQKFISRLFKAVSTFPSQPDTGGIQSVFAEEAAEAATGGGGGGSEGAVKIFVMYGYGDQFSTWSGPHCFYLFTSNIDWSTGGKQISLTLSPTLGKAAQQNLMGAQLDIGVSRTCVGESSLISVENLADTDFMDERVQEAVENYAKAAYNAGPNSASMTVLLPKFSRYLETYFMDTKQKIHERYAEGDILSYNSPSYMIGEIMNYTTLLTYAEVLSALGLELLSVDSEFQANMSRKGVGTLNLQSQVQLYETFEDAEEAFDSFKDEEQWCIRMAEQAAPDEEVNYTNKLNDLCNAMNRFNEEKPLSFMTTTFSDAGELKILKDGGIVDDDQIPAVVLGDAGLVNILLGGSSDDSDWLPPGNEGVVGAGLNIRFYTIDNFYQPETMYNNWVEGGSDDTNPGGIPTFRWNKGEDSNIISFSLLDQDTMLQQLNIGFAKAVEKIGSNDPYPYDNIAKSMLSLKIDLANFFKYMKSAGAAASSSVGGPGIITQIFALIGTLGGVLRAKSNSDKVFLDFNKAERDMASKFIKWAIDIHGLALRAKVKTLPFFSISKAAWLLKNVRVMVDDVKFQLPSGEVGGGPAFFSSLAGAVKDGSPSPTLYNILGWSHTITATEAYSEFLLNKKID